MANRIARYGGAGAQLGFLLPFSRRQELEADRLGVDYMARAGFRPSEAVSLWRNFQGARAGSAPQFMSTHPSDATRIQQLEAYNRSRGYR
jgi:predicted Zn-dependent protease